MELVKVNDKELEAVLKSTRSKPRKLQMIIEKFMSSNEKITKVVYEEGEYKSVWTAASSMSKAIQASKYRIKPKVLNGELYLVKVDD